MNRGSAAEMPGCAAQPGCIAANDTWSAGTRRAHSRMSETWARFAWA